MDQFLTVVRWILRCLRSVLNWRKFLSMFHTLSQHRSFCHHLRCLLWTGGTLNPKIFKKKIRDKSPKQTFSEMKLFASWPWSFRSWMREFVGIAVASRYPIKSLNFSTNICWASRGPNGLKAWAFCYGFHSFEEKWDLGESLLSRCH